MGDGRAMYGYVQHRLIFVTQWREMLTSIIVPTSKSCSEMLKLVQRLWLGGERAARLFVVTFGCYFRVSLLTGP
jgi:hypothetical protein